MADVAKQSRSHAREQTPNSNNAENGAETGEGPGTLLFADQARGVDQEPVDCSEHIVKEIGRVTDHTFVNIFQHW